MKKYLLIMTSLFFINSFSQAPNISYSSNSNTILKGTTKIPLMSNNISETSNSGGIKDSTGNPTIFNLPTFVDVSGNVYLADQSNHKIQKRTLLGKTTISATIDPISNIVVCNGETISNINFSDSDPNTIFNWTNNITSIGLAASGTGNIAGFTATNTSGNPVVSTVTVTPSVIGRLNNYYIRYSGGNPWGQNDNNSAMDAVFGALNWQLKDFLTVNPTAIFDSNTRFVYMDGSDAGAIELNNFLIANLPLIQNWVAAGGRLYLKAAPNYGGDINFGFGGVICSYPHFSGTVSATVLGHPIYQGPFTPVATGYTGNYFAHAILTGGIFTNLMNGNAPGCVLGSMNWGSGFVMFGTSTMPNFQNPKPDSQNLQQNIISYTAGPSGVVLSGTQKTFTITVNPTVTPTFTQVPAICSGATLADLPTTSDNGITGLWSPAMNNTATTVYTFTPTAGLCATTATMTITVNPNVTPTFTQVSAICSGATLDDLPTTSDNGITGTWSPALNNTATTEYTFTPTVGLCATSATMTIVVNQCTAIPDANFEQVLVTKGYDTVIDGKVITSNISGLTYLDVNYAGISDFTGIEAFTSLTELHCNHNAFAAINLSANTALTYLDITYNQLTSIDIAANTALTYFICQFNQITSISVATNTLLTDFSCYENPISTIDVSMLPNLRNLGVSSMNLTTLDVSSNHNLIALYAGFNQLTSLNAQTGNIAILEDFQSFNNPNLSCILVDDVAVANTKTKWYKDVTSNYKVTLNSTPTFTQVAPICSGATLSDLPTTSENGITGSWSPTMNNMATTEYTFTPAVGECASTATMTIVVNQCTQVFCIGARVSNLTPSGADIKWYVSATSTTALGVTTLLATNNYYYTQTTNGVTGTKIQADVIVNPTSIAGSITGASGIVCYNSGKALTISTTHRGDVQWQSASSIAGPFVPIPLATATTLNTANLTATTYFNAVVTNGVCPSKTTAPVKVNVRPQSVAGTITGGGITVCPGTNSTILALSGQTGKVIWYSSTDNDNYVSLPSIGSNTSLRVLNLPTTTYYRTEVTNGLGCTSATSASVVVNVKPAINPGTISGTYIIPYNTRATLAVTGYDAGATFLWKYGLSPTGVFYNGNQPIIINSTYTTAKLVNDVYFKVVVTKDGCSTSSAPFFINVGTRGKFSDSVAQSVDAPFDAIAYPNPSSTEFTIETSSKGATIRVYDVVGRLIENRQTNTNSVQVGKNYATGVYNVIVNQGTKVKTLRVIKK